MSPEVTGKDFFYSDRKYVRPDWRRLFPRFDIKEVGGLLKTLTGEQWSDQALKHQYLEYRILHIWVRVILAAGLTGLAFFYALYQWIDHASEVNSWMQRLPIVVPAILGLAVFLVASLAVTLWRRLGSRGRFFRFIHRAELSLSHRHSFNSAEHSYARAVALAGRGARCLFVALQGSRLTWKAPPSVADYTLSLTYPLIDVTISVFPQAGISLFPQDSSSNLFAAEYYARFLHDAAALVMLGRENLIPRLRQRYSMLSVRNVDEDEDEDIPERDALYIDPMRNHHRWSVVKDYFFPVASWLSLLLSLIAFVVSISR